MQAVNDFMTKRRDFTFPEKGKGWCSANQYKVKKQKGQPAFKQVLLLGDKEGRVLGCVLKLSRYQGLY